MSTCIHLNMWNSCFAAKEQPSSKQWPKFSHALWPSPLYWLHFIFTWDIALLQWLFMPNYLYICHISYNVDICTNAQSIIYTNKLPTENPTGIPPGSHWDDQIQLGCHHFIGMEIYPGGIPVSIIPVTVYEVLVDLKLSSLK